MTKIDFIGKRKIYYTISISLILIGILVSAIFGVKLDIQFKGGTILQYSYSASANMDTKAAAALAAKDLKTPVDVVVDSVLQQGKTTDTKLLIFENDQNSVSSDAQQKLFQDLTAKYPAAKIQKYQSSTVTPEMGAEFFRRSILIVLAAALLIILYIWFRFRKIGGLPAGLTAFIALLHDIVIVFAAFSIFRIPINDSFIAVALTILGYSINDTIVVYDRVRENRKVIGGKEPFKDIVNLSINQTFARSINTTLTAFTSIAIVLIFALIYNIDSIRTFAMPMMVGIATGCYSTICIAGPLWVSWEEHKEKNKKNKKAAKRTADGWT